jgi:hypothetical protein
VKGILADVRIGYEDEGCGVKATDEGIGVVVEGIRMCRRWGCRR